MTTVVVGLGTAGHKVTNLLTPGEKDIIIAIRHLDETKDTLAAFT